MVGQVKQIDGRWVSKNGNELVWLDVDEEPTTNGMKAGVCGKKNFLVFLTKEYFARKFCQLELEEALKLRRNVVL